MDWAGAVLLQAGRQWGIKSQPETEPKPETPTGRDDSSDTGDMGIFVYIAIALCIAGLVGVFVAGRKKHAK